MRRQSGFTLIELIIVIVILGILAVTAAPQFFNFGSDARTSTVRGLQGSINGAADLVYARSAIEGIETNDSATNNADGIETIFGYPTATEDGIQAALNITATDWDIVADATLDPSQIRFSPAGYNDPNAAFADILECSVTYTEAADANSRPEVVVDDNC
ncbi:prepilin-type N-terminal cleavage/methylation domain-containing protein [Aliidiomarina sp. Khilg15.8]